MPAATLPTPAKRSRAARPKADAVLVDAVDVALAAAREAAEHPGDVGEHLAASMDADRLASHTFACTMRGYRGWHWTVTVARAPRSKNVTVCEVELLPGDEAILAPEWLPWSERLRPGDIGPGDVLPFRADDPRLVPGYTPTGDEEEDRVAIEELALARTRVLSADGRDEAAQRWYAGSRGPTTPGAIQAASDCGSCGFMVMLQGTLGQVFGVCANAWSEDDGRVVSLDHGCGAHSETDVEPHPTDWPDDAPVIDEMSVEIVDLTDAPATTGDALTSTGEAPATTGATGTGTGTDAETGPAPAAAEATISTETPADGDVLTQGADSAASEDEAAGVIADAAPDAQVAHEPADAQPADAEQPSAVRAGTEPSTDEHARPDVSSAESDATDDSTAGDSTAGEGTADNSATGGATTSDDATGDDATEDDAAQGSVTGA